MGQEAVLPRNRRAFPAPIAVSRAVGPSQDSGSPRAQIPSSWRIGGVRIGTMAFGPKVPEISRQKTLAMARGSFFENAPHLLWVDSTRKHRDVSPKDCTEAFGQRRQLIS
jgi:hypothetical protein